jgi:hypothetical protein
LALVDLPVAALAVPEAFVSPGGVPVTTGGFAPATGGFAPVTGGFAGPPGVVVATVALGALGGVARGAGLVVAALVPAGALLAAGFDWALATLGEPRRVLALTKIQSACESFRETKGRGAFSEAAPWAKADQGRYQTASRYQTARRKVFPPTENPYPMARVRAPF